RDSNLQRTGNDWIEVAFRTARATSYATTASPSVPDALAALAARGRTRVAVASYFTAPGRFATQCAEDAPWIASAPLGTHPAMARLLLHRYDHATPSAAPTRELATA
ncbi:CbiX/SirB N-terminal domain-containing protein, partial [Streptomyces nigra]